MVTAFAHLRFGSSAYICRHRLLLDELRARGGTVIQEDEAKGYIAALVPYQLGPGAVHIALAVLCLGRVCSKSSGRRVPSAPLTS